MLNTVLSRRQIRLTTAFQPRRLIIAPAAVGCKRLLAGVSCSGQPVALSQKAEMMSRVPQNDVHHGPGTGSKTVRSPDTRPRGWRDTVHEGQRARSLQLELRDEITDAAQVELAFRAYIVSSNPGSSVTSPRLIRSSL